MRRRGNLRKAFSLILSLATVVATLEADAVVSVRFRRARAITDKNTKAQHLRVEFDISSQFILSTALLYYRSRPSEKYSEVDLERDPKLRYVATIPSADEIEYYVELKPERGSSWLYGSPKSPYLLSGADVKKEQEVRKRNRILFSAVVVTVAIVVSIFGIAKVKRH